MNGSDGARTTWRSIRLGGTKDNDKLAREQNGTGPDKLGPAKSQLFKCLKDIETLVICPMAKLISRKRSWRLSAGFVCKLKIRY